jgi:hypothetical protein
MPLSPSEEQAAVAINAPATKTSERIFFIMNTLIGMSFN